MLSILISVKSSIKFLLQKLYAYGNRSSKCSRMGKGITVR